MSANNKIVVRSCSNCSSGQATMPTLTITEMHVTIENIDILEVAQKFYVELFYPISIKRI
jgi:hypothetical protein